ncbi:hypothetical protein NWF32_00025 [Pseudomonas qingdaonensis]|nr:hypothetical protein [Pseudomonas qingdaonensis]
MVAASEKRAGGQTVYYLGYNQDMTVEYIQACAMWSRAFNYAAGEIEEGIWPDEDPTNTSRPTPLYSQRAPDRRVDQPAEQPSWSPGRGGHRRSRVPPGPS